MTGCTVLLDGTAIDALAQVRVRQVLSLPTTVEVTVSGTLAQCAPEARLGAALTVSMTGPGTANATTSAEICGITEHHDASGLVATRIVAQDRLARLRAQHSQHTFLDTSVRDHAESLLAGVGLTLSTDVDLGPVQRHRYQGGSDDLQHLRSLLEPVGAYLTVQDDTARAVTLTPSDDVVPLRLGTDLMELTRGVTASAAPARVLASGWDHGRAESLTTEVTASLEGAPWVDLRGTAEESEPLGTQVLLLDHDALDEAALVAAARATLERGRALAAPIEARAVGRPDLEAGMTAEFRAHDDVPIALGVLTTVDHTWSGTGLTTSLSTSPPAAAVSPAPAASLVRGTVTEVQDPESRGRVRVQIPTHADAVSPWLDVLVPGGDTDRGLLAIPRTGAVVAVLLPGGDLGRGLVLGAALGVDGPVVDVVAGGDVAKQAWHSSRHQFLALDDRNGTVHLRNRGGSGLRMSGNALELHAATDMVIEAPGRTLRIRAAAVEFEEATS